MLLNKTKTALALATVFGIIYTIPVNAELLIHTGNPDSSIDQGLIGIGSHVTNLGTPFYLKKNVVGFGKDIPLSLAMDSLKPPKWSVVYNSDVPSDQPVTWAHSGNWNDVLADIAKNNNLVSVIDWNAHNIRLMEMTPSPSDGDKTAMASVLSADDSPFAKTTTKTTTIVKQAKIETVVSTEVGGGTATDKQKVGSAKSVKAESKKHTVVSKKMVDSINLVDGLVYEQGDDGCLNRKIDIEKMVMDTNWLDGAAKKTNTDSAKPAVNSKLDPEFLEHKKEQEQIAKDKARIAKLREDYNKAYILSGNGSFQDFVNGGGIVTSANNDSHYVYVYKKGTLFNTINLWSEKNGFTVKNDVFDDHHIDYENVTDVKLEGTYKEVITTVLSKYRNAKTPVMFTFYEAGGSKVLHIFESKYRSSYI